MLKRLFTQLLYRNIGHQRQLASQQPSLSIAPKPDDTWQSPIAVLVEQGKLREAILFADHAIEQNADSYELHIQIGILHAKLKEYQLAEQYFQKATALEPIQAGGYKNLGAVYILSGNLGHAQAALERALELDPHSSTPWANMGYVMLLQGKADEAKAAFTRALAIDPHQLLTWQCKLRQLLCDPKATLQEVWEAHQEFSEILEKPILAKHTPAPFSNPPIAGRRIRIAYLSSDFKNHPVGYNMLPILKHHDRGQFEIFLYGIVLPDESATLPFQQLAHQWRNVYNKSDKEIAALMRADGIDILVVLAGHFDDNRLLVTAYRPAPVQVSYHDPVTSGLQSMDYLISDITLTPRDSAEAFTEKLIRLPTYYVHAPFEDSPPVDELPARQNGYITFGSFNNTSKLSSEVIGLWSAVLKAVPKARLLLKYNNVFSEPAIVTHYEGLFRAHGIDSGRLIFNGKAYPRGSHLALYNQIDIALDPFPFTGATTTFEALWMGVPVVSLAGERMVARWSASMLRRVGLDWLISRDPDEYVQIAAKLASNLDQLAALRSTLRTRLVASPLCDARRRTRHLERAFRYMWRKWCQQQAGADIPISAPHN